MLIKGAGHGPSRAVALPLAVALGLVFGALLGPSLLAPLAPGKSPSALDSPPPPPPAAPPAAPTELATLQVAIRDADWQVLARARERALAQGMIVQDERDVVPASVTLGSDSGRGTARLKGDWLDHVDSDQWSLRFELDQPIRGMRRFSIQHPKTRGYVMEWLVMQTAHREGVLAPRSDFVHVAINGQDKGVYYLEEHFSKELLESQQRREGPIVRFDESAMWATWLQHGFHKTGILSSDLWPAVSFYDARVDGFGEAHLMHSPTLNARLQRALEQARDLQRLATADLDDHPLRRQQALTQLEGKTIDDLFVTDKLGRWLAIYTLFRGFHGLAWHQFRFYHDPVLDRLEPIVFDTGANFLEHPGELALSAPEARWFRSSDAVMAAAFEELGRMTEPGWVEALVRDVRPRLLQIGAALSQAGIIVPGIEIAPLIDVLLPQQVASLREIVRPVVAAGFDARLVGLRLDHGDDLRAIELDTWATTTIPTQISGFRFGNGRVVSAAEALVGIVGEADSEGAVTHWRDGAVLLPRQGNQIRFRLPIDRRLAGLSEVQAIKRAIRQQLQPEGQGQGKVEVEVLFRTLAERADRREALVLRHSPAADLAQQGRPPAPSLLQALQLYPFLHYDFDVAQLRVDGGRHQLDGDFLLPAGMRLHLGAGTELVFKKDAVMLCAALEAEGTKAQPVRLSALDPQQGWSGLQVIGGAGTSHLHFVELDNATAVERGGWQSSGGATFYRAPVEFYDCTFRHAHCEDSVNLVGVEFRYERCTFDGGPHDLFDGDFVTGDVVDCRFLNSGEDAIDVSGSQIRVRGCSFDNVGDKAFSVGEDSRVEAQHCHVLSASIAAASKDRSHAVLDDLVVDRVEHYVLAAYVKKPEFGASTMVATNLHWTGGGQPQHLAQTGCSIRVDGEQVPTQAVDVEALYRQHVLGK